VLLEDLTVKGFLGDEILVKPGFARNFLIPTKKAVYATPDNRQKYIITKTVRLLDVGGWPL
jgi:large subunit ribosomal protein L9